MYMEKTLKKYESKEKKKTTNQVSELYAIERDASWENFPFFAVLCFMLKVAGFSCLLYQLVSPKKAAFALN